MQDKKPFFEFDFADFTDADVAVLDRFRKEVFNVSSLVGYAEDLVFLSALKGQFKTLLREPSDDLIRFAVKAARLVDGSVTQKVVDRFRPLVRESISAAILEIVEQSFLPSGVASLPDPADAQEPEPPIAAQSEPGPHGKRQAVTTEEELKVYQLVTEMIADVLPDRAKLRYQDTTGYFAILYAKSTGWFARFQVQDRDRKCVFLRLPAGQVRELAPGHDVDETPNNFGPTRMYFSSLDELAALKPLFAEAVRQVI